MKLKQQTLDQCWSGVKPAHPRLSFLRLPSSVRRQIYIDAGFPFQRYIPIPVKTRPAEQIDRDAGYTAISLLLTCQTIHHEAQQLLLADNVFTACLRRPGDLYYLQKFTDRIASMRRLLIYVKPDDKLDQQLICWCRTRSAFKQLPICETHSRPRLRAAFLEFREALELILANTQRGMLELGLILYTGDDVELAKWLLEPLASIRATPLADCAIFLGEKYDLYKSEIARKYATQCIADSTTPVGAAFRFSDLPPELRHLVLSFTDLVVPGDAIECLSAGAYSMHTKGNELGCGGDELNYGRFPDGSCLHHSFSCAWFACGYSRYCRCWSPPTAILLCSSWMYKEAMAVFFGMNRFVSMSDDILSRLQDPRTRNQKDDALAVH